MFRCLKLHDDNPKDYDVIIEYCMASDEKITIGSHLTCTIVLDDAWDDGIAKINVIVHWNAFANSIDLHYVAGDVRYGRRKRQFTTPKIYTISKSCWFWVGKHLFSFVRRATREDLLAIIDRRKRQIAAAVKKEEEEETQTAEKPSIIEE